MESPRTSADQRPRTLLFLGGYLILITALVRLGTSLYLPALPRMGIELQLTPSQLASTMTAYLAAFAIASILLGPVSDHWGRRVLVLGGIATYFIGSACCALAPGYGLLLIGRILQAVGGSAIPVATRAMSREAFNDRDMIGLLGWIGVVTGLVPVLAPVLGGFLTQGFGWRSNFYLLTAATLAVGLFSHWQAPETLPRNQRQPFHLAGTLKAYATMLVCADFMLPIIPIMLCFAVQGAYLVGSPFIFIHVMHFTPAAFGATSLVLVGALVAGRYLCMALLKRRDARAAYLSGSLLTFLGGLLFLAFIGMHWTSAVPILGTSAIFCLGFGAMLPIAMKAGLSAFPDRVGTASALFGCLTLGATAAGSALIGSLLQRSPQDIGLLAVYTFASGFLVLLFSILGRRALS